MGIRVIAAGPRTTVQDLGRPGYQSSGFAPGGVMDRIAMRRANLLVNNRDDEPVLEFCLVGPMLMFEEPTNLAISGGDFTGVIGDRSYPAETVIHAEAGEMLTIIPGKSGTFGVIAFGGGLDIPSVMGSCSTSLKCRIGGFKGRALEKGDVLNLKNPHYGKQKLSGRSLPKRELPCGDRVWEIPVITGPQDDLFTEEGLKTFFGSVYKVTTQSDRMGFRLEGPSVETKAGSDIISDGIAFGSVQIPGNGMPIVMMADRQTTGGYAKLATVASFWLSEFAQLRPGMEVRFQPISVNEAQKKLREDLAEWRQIRRSLIGPLF